MSSLGNSEYHSFLKAKETLELLKSAENTNSNRFRQPIKKYLGQFTKLTKVGLSMESLIVGFFFSFLALIPRFYFKKKTRS